MSFDRYDRIPFADLLEKISTGVVDGQLALETNRIETENLLLNTELAEKTVIVAVVETVDQQGNIVKIETLLNEKPISLYELGLSPVSLQFADVEVECDFLGFLHQKESSNSSKTGFIRDLRQSVPGYDNTNRLKPFFDTLKNPEKSQNYFCNNAMTCRGKLAVSSVTPSAIGWKIQKESWRLKATIKPKNEP